MSAYIIIGTGTGVGKTFVTSAICRELRAQKRKVAAFKPVISGYDAADENNDTALLLKSLGLPNTVENIDRISPWRFAAPLSPNMAAEREGRTLDFDSLITFSQSTIHDPRTTTLIETAGGIMSPLTNHHTMLDWITALRMPVILVGGSYLGALSHMLSALNILQNEAVPVARIVISESAGSTVSLAETVSTLERFVKNPIPVVKIPRIHAGQKIPPLSIV